MAAHCFSREIVTYCALLNCSMCYVGSKEKHRPVYMGYAGKDLRISLHLKK